MVRYKGNQEKHLKHLDNFGGLMSFWCMDENCNKTLGEVLPLYEKRLKEFKETQIEWGQIGIVCSDNKVHILNTKENKNDKN